MSGIVFAAVVASALAADAPAGPPVAHPTATYMVWDLDALALEERVVTLLRDLLSSELEKILGKRLVTPPGLDDDLRKQVVACGRTTECLAEAAGGLGVNRVIVGVASTLGDAYNVNLKVVDAREGVLVTRAQATLTGDRDKMLDTMQLLVFELIDPNLLRGALVVDVALEGVEVHVDSERVGVTPLDEPIIPLEPGEHTLKASSPMMKDYFRFFTVHSGKTTTLKIDAEEIAALQAELKSAEDIVSIPLYKRWWFWTIIGGVVAAGAGTAVYAVARSDDGSAVPDTTLGTVDMRR